MKYPKDLSLFKRNGWIMAGIFSLILILSLLWNWQQMGKKVYKLALNSLELSFEKDVVYRRWATNHGGVYVPVSKHTQPNPYLSHMPERDITTPSGIRLTLVNPAYMTRQVHELGKEQYGIQGNISSLKPLRPENAPDQWEEEALKSFEKGAKEAVVLMELEGLPHMRMMKPLITEEGCLKCHGHQGYQVGDILGGISVSTPTSSYVEHIKSRQFSLLKAHGIVWALGLFFIGLMTSRIVSVRMNAEAERQKMERDLKQSEEKYRSLVENLNEIVYILNDKAEITYISPSIKKYGGYQPEELIGKRYIDFVHPDDRHGRIEQYHKILAGIDETSEYRYLAKDGTPVWIRTNAKPVYKNGHIIGIQGTLVDISERKQAEEEKEKLQARFIQAQKMESVGRLAGGVAHDINNTLNVILGYAEFIRDSFNASDPNHGFIEEIIAAGKKSSNIVKQLLAFARKQIISPKVCNLNEIVENMLKMLRRLIGEDIDLSWKPAPQLWQVKIDDTQIDQILANLCVNARDAITGTGKITIETDNVTLDEAYCYRNAGCLPGEYVMLSVSDNGEGMDKETLNNIFEPFFTTKPVGMGTGLGLATIYGIVKQNNGFINVYSELFKGTTIKIYLPHHREKVTENQTENAVEIPTGQGETVLIVEDEESVMKMSKLLLEKLGYTVLTADIPDEAIRLAEEQAGAIDLLITDVVMPGMDGHNLANKLNNIYPNIKTLFMSGYPVNVMDHHGILDKGVHFIQKPFSYRDLAVKLRKVLEQS